MGFKHFAPGSENHYSCCPYFNKSDKGNNSCHFYKDSAKKKGKILKGRPIECLEVGNYNECPRVLKKFISIIEED